MHCKLVNKLKALSIIIVQGDMLKMPFRKEKKLIFNF